MTLRHAQGKLHRRFIVAMLPVTSSYFTNKRGKTLREFQRLLVLLWPNNKQIRRGTKIGDKMDKTTSGKKRNCQQAGGFEDFWRVSSHLHIPVRHQMKFPWQWW